MSIFRALANAAAQVGGAAAGEPDTILIRRRLHDGTFVYERRANHTEHTITVCFAAQDHECVPEPLDGQPEPEPGCSRVLRCTVKNTWKAEESPIGHAARTRLPQDERTAPEAPGGPVKAIPARHGLFQAAEDARP
jgi:hypothetical protein